MSDEHQIPWGAHPARPTQSNGAWATALRHDGDQYSRVKPIEGIDEGIQDPEPDRDDRP